MWSVTALAKSVILKIALRKNVSAIHKEEQLAPSSFKVGNHDKPGVMEQGRERHKRSGGV